MKNLIRVAALVAAVLSTKTALAGLACQLMTPIVKIYTADNSGSGVVLRGTEVLTNAHVVGDAKLVKVVLFIWEDERKIVGRMFVSGEVVLKDEHKDLALIELDCIMDVPPVEFATEEGLEILEPIVHVGAPFSEDIQIFRGVVIDQDHGGLIQTDAFVQPGCSGGALWVKQEGQWKLLGVLTGAFRGTGISFFIPISTIREFLGR